MQPATPDDPGAPTPPPEELRPAGVPLSPPHVGEAGEDADPEQDIAPNLGGEGQMQDA